MGQRRKRQYTIEYCFIEQMHQIVHRKTKRVVAAFECERDAANYAIGNEQHVSIPIYYRKALLISRQMEL